MPRRILLVVEHASLSQVVRLLTLAKTLDRERWEVHFACATFDPFVFGGSSFALHSIASLPKERIERAALRGRRMYETRDLEGYVKEELSLYDLVQPDVVVGDLRLSLAVSAPLARVPLVTLINAYWSREAVFDEFPVPEHPIVRWMGPRLAKAAFPYAMPRVFERVAWPVNELRRRHGMSKIGDLRDVLTFGDRTVFPDTEALVPTRGRPAHQSYLGPVLWSPEIATPPFFGELPASRPVVYVTLGSSGKVECLPTVLQGLSRIDVSVIVATAGRARVSPTRPGMWITDYVPGAEAARKAQVVICNGGSSTAYQALSEGTPVLGIPSNLDQYLAMTTIEQSGAGVLLRAGTLTPTAVERAVTAVLRDQNYRQAALGVAEDFARYDAGARFAGVLDEVTHRTEKRSEERECEPCRLRELLPL